MAPANSDCDATTMYLKNGTFSAPLDFHPILNVLAVDPPLLIDTPQQTWLPRVTSFQAGDNDYSEPMLAVAAWRARPRPTKRGVDGAAPIGIHRARR